MSFIHTQTWALYNEIDDHAADWLENLVRMGLIAPGVVDRRSIEDIRADDLRGFRQVHLFAGIGVWSYGLRRIGVPDDLPLWTGSCPCQPFSAAGEGGGMDDERHLWPALYHLIRECRPARFFGEQVASKDGLGWLDLVLTDMEGAGYTIGALDTCSAGSGAPHIRQRLRIAAYDSRFAAGGVVNNIVSRLERQRDGHSASTGQWAGSLRSVAATSGVDRLACCNNDEWWADIEIGQSQGRTVDGRSGAALRLAHDDDFEQWGGGDAGSTSGEGLRPEPSGCDGAGFVGHIERPGPTNGFWRDADWLFSRDGKWRPVEPGTFPLVDGAAFRMGSGCAYEGKSRQGMLKGYGNAIDAEATADFLEACFEWEADRANGSHRQPVADVLNIDDLLG